MADPELSAYCPKTLFRFPYFPNVIWCQFLCAAQLARAVQHILLVAPGHQMGRIDASWVVARMDDI